MGWRYSNNLHISTKDATVTNLRKKQLKCQIHCDNFCTNIHDITPISCCEKLHVAQQAVRSWLLRWRRNRAYFWREKEGGHLRNCTIINWQQVITFPVSASRCFAGHEEVTPHSVSPKNTSGTIFQIRYGCRGYLLLSVKQNDGTRMSNGRILTVQLKTMQHLHILF